MGLLWRRPPTQRALLFCPPAFLATDHCPQNVAQANESGNTALHWACLMGHEGVVRLLLEAGASPSALNK